MDKITFIEVDYLGVITEHAIIDRGNNEFTSMPKLMYEEMIKPQTPMVIDGD
jgi:hypothetical protein